MPNPTSQTEENLPLGAEELRLMNAYWCAANYPSVGQIYLLDNSLFWAMTNPASMVLPRSTSSASSAPLERGDEKAKRAAST